MDSFVTDFEYEQLFQVAKNFENTVVLQMNVDVLLDNNIKDQVKTLKFLMGIMKVLCIQKCCTEFFSRKFDSAVNNIQRDMNVLGVSVLLERKLLLRIIAAPFP